MTEPEGLEISPNLTEKQQLRAEQFITHHVDTPVEIQASYHYKTVKRWREEEYPKTHRPLWLRRTFDMGSEFEATVDYCVVIPGEKVINFGSIMIDRDVEVVLLTEAEPDVGEVVSKQPYSLEAIVAAIEQVEQSVAVTE
jgi:hypothetical protein